MRADRLPSGKVVLVGLERRRAASGVERVQLGVQSGGRLRGRRQAEALDAGQLLVEGRQGSARSAWAVWAVCQARSAALRAARAAPVNASRGWLRAAAALRRPRRVTG